MSSKTSAYTVEDDGSETFLQYSILTLYQDGTQIHKCYAPDGTLWFTITSEGTTYENAFTLEIRNKTDQACAIMSLIGTGSDDLVREIKENESGFTTDEYFYTKSGTYPALHMVYETLVDNVTK